MEGISKAYVAALATYNVIGSLPKQNWNRNDLDFKTIEAAYNTKQWQFTRAAALLKSIEP